MQHNGNENIAPAPQNTPYFSNENTAHLLGKLEAQETAAKENIVKLMQTTERLEAEITSLKEWKAKCIGAYLVVLALIPLLSAIVGAYSNHIFDKKNNSEAGAPKTTASVTTSEAPAERPWINC